MRSNPLRHDPASYPWHLTLETRFGDMDPNRHLNNVAIARLFEETRVRFHAALRAAADVGRPHFLVANVAIDYVAEGLYPDSAELGLGIASIGTSSYRVAIGLFQAGKTIALCETVLVYRGDTGGPGPLPPEVRTILEGYALKG